jgi:hypothetical protein
LKSFSVSYSFSFSRPEDREFRAVYAERGINGRGRLRRMFPIFLRNACNFFARGRVVEGTR